MAPPEAVADSVEGLTCLKKKYTIGPLSNGNVALLTNMAKRAGFPWDVILSAELAKHYKPDREAHLTAVSLLGLRPEEVAEQHPNLAFAWYGEEPFAQGPPGAGLDDEGLRI